MADGDFNDLTFTDRGGTIRLRNDVIDLIEDLGYIVNRRCEDTLGSNDVVLYRCELIDGHEGDHRFTAKDRGYVVTWTP